MLSSTQSPGISELCTFSCPCMLADGPDKVDRFIVCQNNIGQALSKQLTDHCIQRYEYALTVQSIDGVGSQKDKFVSGEWRDNHAGSVQAYAPQQTQHYKASRLVIIVRELRDWNNFHKNHRNAATVIIDRDSHNCFVNF